jgi:hypothetical protein
LGVPTKGRFCMAYEYICFSLSSRSRVNVYSLMFTSAHDLLIQYFSLYTISKRTAITYFYNFFLFHFYLVCEAIDTSATPGLLCQPRVIVKMIVEKQTECRLSGETEVLGEKPAPAPFLQLSIAITLRNKRLRIRFPARAERFLPDSVQLSEAHPTSYSVGTWSSFPVSKTSRGVKFVTSM